MAVMARGGALMVVIVLADWLGPGVGGLETPMAVGVAALGLGLVTELAAWPFVLRAEHALARRFGLSDEPRARWTRTHLGVVTMKAVGWAVAAAVGALLVSWWPARWWVVGTLLFGVAGLARDGLLPGLLGSYLFGTRPLPRGTLRGRLAVLARRAEAPVVSIETWRPAHHRDVANAAVVGLGPARRILVSESLVEDYSDDEIEVVVAHELGHHVHRDLWQTLVLEVATVGLALVTIERLVVQAVAPTGAMPIDVGGLALAVLTAGVVRVMVSPLAKWHSRRQERRADTYALTVTGNRAAFVSGLRRLGAQHLAETAPSRLAEWLFYRHPPLARRLEASTPRL